MKLENQVCTLEQAIKLRELGVSARSAFWYVISKEVLRIEIDPKETSMFGNHSVPVLGKALTVNANCVNAYTVAELGVMLPAEIPTNSNIFSADLIIRKDVLGEWLVAYDKDMQTEGGNGATVKDIYRCYDGYATEAEARAAMLIHLLENNIISSDEVNSRLNA